MTFNFKLQAAQLESHLQTPATFEEPLQSVDERIQTYINSAFATTDPVAERLRSEYLHAGPLTPLLDDESVTEIIINGPDSIVYEQAGHLHLHPDCFLTPVSFRNFVIQLSQEAGFLTNLEHPFADGRWRQFRVHVADNPCGESGPVICLRRQATQPWTLERLEQAGWCTREQKQQIEGIFSDAANGLVVGSTGCGKTSVLNAFLARLPQKRRVVMIEDTRELVLPNSLSSRLLTRVDPQNVLPEVTQQTLVKQSLRMRPDSIVMGEVRGGEAKDLLMAWATGHSQSWSTLHADSARQALVRLEMLIQLGAPQWSLQAIRQLILLSLKYIVVVERNAQGQRRLKGLSRLISLEENGILVEQLI
jgi:pilus assembly protein CpaF